MYNLSRKVTLRIETLVILKIFLLIVNLGNIYSLESRLSRIPTDEGDVNDAAPYVGVSKVIKFDDADQIFGLILQTLKTTRFSSKTKRAKLK